NPTQHDKLIDQVNDDSQAKDPREVLPAVVYQTSSRRRVLKKRPQVGRPALARIAKTGTTSNYAGNQWLQNQPKRKERSGSAVQINEKAGPDLSQTVCKAKRLSNFTRAMNAGALFNRSTSKQNQP